MADGIDRPPAPLQFKPDLAEAVRRWEAFYAGELLDRPLVCVTAPRAGAPPVAGSDYRQRVFGDMDDIIDRALLAAEWTYFGGEQVPAFWMSFGPDEVAAFCGAELGWDPDSGNTNWSVPCVDSWDEASPIRLREDNPLWQRMLAFYRRAAEKLDGKMLISTPDLHTNMDLLAAMRGPERLCLDLVDRPETIDRAMAEARDVFPELWSAVRQAGRMDERGFCHMFHAMNGAAVLQCDFSGLIGPEMFRRWVMSALEEEAEIVKHAFYHWDGPGALVHMDDLTAAAGIHTLGYVPGAGQGSHVDCVELLQRVQAAGKAVQAVGTIEQVKFMHRQLDPARTLYLTWAPDPDAADELLEWFVANT